MDGRRYEIAVIGGGIAGLAAAHALRGDPRLAVTVYEGSPRIGGKLHSSELAGVRLDEGAEAMLARRPEGLDLAAAAGLGDRLVNPGTTSSGVWTRGALRPLPGGHVMGVPGDLEQLAASGVLSPEGSRRAAEDLTLPAAPVTTDVSVGEYVGARLGAEVTDRLVEPMLGGVYAGRAADLSLDATLPQIAGIARRGEPLLAGVRELRERTPDDPRPVFATVIGGGLGALPAAVAAASGARVRTGRTVRELRRTETGWRLVAGPAHDPEEVTADAVIVAVPARPAARLLAGVAPAAAAELSRIDYASMAIVALAFREGAFPEPPTGSGFLVPAVDGRTVKAVTFSSVKWPHLTRDAGGLMLVRCSIGRIGEEQVLQRPDEELIAAAVADLGAACGVRERPVDARVTRWGGALPQYTVGHLGRVARIREAVAAVPGLAVCGAAYSGVGVPACVETAAQAAGRVRDHLAAAGQWKGAADSVRGQSGYGAERLRGRAANGAER
ncbi:MAG: protoporphyrinogen oxidase [Streptosporangiales bacterium]|nr:protoporphyrinogen oxidase [Streptosporangiales bacterium]